MMARWMRISLVRSFVLITDLWLTNEHLIEMDRSLAFRMANLPLSKLPILKVRPLVLYSVFMLMK